MSYTLTALKYLVKESPVISTDFAQVEYEGENKAMEEASGGEEGEGLNQRMRDILATRKNEGRHLFMHNALQKWLSAPYTSRDGVSHGPSHGKIHHGVINAAVAENCLMDDLISTVMQIPTMNKFKPEVTHYFDLRGSPPLRKALARFLTRQLLVEPDEALNPDLMTVTNGAGTGMEMLVQVLTEPGYSWMSPTPHCKQLEYNLTIRGGGAATVPIPLSSRLDGGATKPFELTIRKVKIAYKLAMQRGKKIAGIILCNPHNPLGTIYSKELILDILRFANEEGLHVIFDEVYALSMHEDVPFTSVASIQNLPNPMTTHFVWSCSKDLALSGFRCGVVYSWNPYVNKSLSLLSQFTAVPLPIQDKIRCLLTTQETFLEETFIPFNQIRLQKAKDRMTERLDMLDIPVHQCEAGLFVWCDVSKHLKEKTYAEELDFCEKLLAVGLWVVPGRIMDCVEPGWIRINFARKQEEWREFFIRFPKALEKYHCNDDSDEVGRFSAENLETSGSGSLRGSGSGQASREPEWWETESVAKMLDDGDSEMVWNEAQKRLNEIKYPDQHVTASKRPLAGSRESDGDTDGINYSKNPQIRKSDPPVAEETRETEQMDESTGVTEEKNISWGIAENSTDATTGSKRASAASNRASFARKSQTLKP